MYGNLLELFFKAVHEQHEQHYGYYKDIVKLWKTALGLDESEKQKVGPVGADPEILNLKKNFEKQFEQQGILRVMACITSPELNGENDREYIDQYFPGVQFSLPLSFYLMRRALGGDKDAAFKFYVRDVERLANEVDVTLDRVPVRSYVEDISRSCLQELAQIKTVPVQANINNYDAA